MAAPEPVPNGKAKHAEEVLHAPTESLVETLPTPPPSVRVANKSKSEEIRDVVQPPVGHSEPKGNGHVQQASDPPAQDTEQAKKRRNVLTRTLWTFIMIGGFISMHFYLPFLAGYARLTTAHVVRP